MEVELKFQVPSAARESVRRAVATSTARVTPMQAVYADTADDRLARAGLALRLRREGRRWVQALKGRGDGLMQRLEHELLLPPHPGVPELDPKRHAGTVAGQALLSALDGAGLQPLYRTDIRRMHRVVRVPGARIEVAFDEGRIVAGARSVAVCEIEFELVSGPPAALLTLAVRWVRRHGLWLDVRTKSERGFRLARGLDQVPAVAWTAAAGGPASQLQQALAQVLPNQAECAAGSGTVDHLQQWRAAVRGLHDALPRRAPAGGDAAEDLAARWSAVLAASEAGVSMVPFDAQAAMQDPALTVLLLQTWAAALAEGAA